MSNYPTGRKKKGKPAGISDKIYRLLKTYTLIAQGKYPSVKSLADEFETSKRTVQRDLEIIRLIDDVDYDQDRKGYRFVHGDRFKKLSLSQNELITLLTAGEAVSRLGGTLGSAFQNLLQKMTALAEPPKGMAKPHFLIKMPGLVKTKNFEENFEVISLCAGECRSVDLEYRAQNSKKVTKRLVDPYGLVFNDGIWIMIGKCHLRKEIRSFALDRVIKAAGRNLYFDRDTDFDLEKYFEKSWGIIDGKVVDVTVRFNSDVADYILRKDKWHPTEKRKVLPGGDIELSYRISGFVEFKHWAYSWLPYVEFIKPGWFRKRVKEELIAAAKLHE